MFDFKNKPYEAKQQYQLVIQVFVALFIVTLLSACMGSNSEKDKTNLQPETGLVPSPSPSPSPTSSNTPTQGNCEAPTVSASADDSQGNIAEYAIDKNSATYWSAITTDPYDTWLQIDCGANITLTAIDIAFFQGDTRISYFILQGSDDGETWRNVTGNLASTGASDAPQRFPFDAPASIRYLRYVALGTSASTQNAISELKPVVNDAQGTPAPIITPAPIANAATPTYPQISGSGATGDVTMYNTTPSSGGACNFGETNVEYYAAINVHSEPGDYQGEWRGGAICGQCAEITTYTSEGPKTAVVRIMDKCPDGYCGIDTGGAIPALLMPDGFGRYNGEWQYVSCDGHPEVSDGEPVLHVLAGSNIWWSRVHVRNGSASVTRITWQSDNDSGELPFAIDPENSFEVPPELMQSNLSSLQLKVHYFGNTTATISISPEELSRPGSYPLQTM